ncbi:NAD(P)H-dependent oxidoreductase [Candidatus Micrarchaeota archaeon]|nr:NAD(P)H-dependent oxidoreductase [Candidatus Micrarchaeota archaeon]
MHLIIFAHPDNKGSHNAAILRYVMRYLKAKSAEFEVIDLYADRFDPVLRLSPESEEKKMLVERYKNLITKAEKLVFISPVWWYNLPAILKGFIDIIFSPGFAHDFNPGDGGLKKRLSGKKAIIINTFGRSEKEFDKNGNEPQIIFDKAILEFCGIEVVSRINWFDVRPPSLVPVEITRKINRVL